MRRNKYILWLGALLICVSTLALGIDSISKGGSYTGVAQTDIHNLIPVPQITFTAVDVSGTSPQPITVGSTVNLDLGKAKLDGSTVISGRLKMDVDMMKFDYDSVPMTLDIILASNTITFVNQANASDTVSGGISLSTDSTETPAIGSGGTTATSLIPSSPVGLHGKVTAYLYFKTTTLTPLSNGEGYYRSSPVAMTIQYS